MRGFWHAPMWEMVRLPKHWSLIMTFTYTEFLETGRDLDDGPPVDLRWLLDAMLALGHRYWTLDNDPRYLLPQLVSYPMYLQHGLFGVRPSAPNLDDLALELLLSEVHTRLGIGIEVQKLHERELGRRITSLPAPTVPYQGRA